MSRRLAVVVAAFALIAAAMVGLAQVTGGDDAHPLGTEVEVGHRDSTSGARTQIGLTVLRVRRGTQEELEQHGIRVDPVDRTATPYYVDARFRNSGSNAVQRNLGVGLESSDGTRISSTLILDLGGKGFPPCRRIGEGALRPGQAYESCTLFLVPDGIGVARVHFLSDNGPGREPELVRWAAE